FRWFMSLLLVSGWCVSERFQRSINRPYRSQLRVHNGMRWGSWGLKDMCPAGMYAAGFSLKVEQHQRKGFWAGDATGLNGIRLHCINPLRCSLCLYEDYATVQSDAGSWGQWTDIKWCSGGFLTSFQLRVEQHRGVWDDTAANNIRFTCSGTGRVLEGSGTWWGDWGNWSDKCQGKGICGIKTKVEVPQGVKDDTALNDARMYC
ncbi:putative vitelline membrane outer layer protein 1-like, partial [Triplophysa rosa]